MHRYVRTTTLLWGQHVCDQRAVPQTSVTFPGLIITDECVFALGYRDPVSTLHSHTIEPRSLLTIIRAKDRRSKKFVADAVFDVSYKQGRDQGWTIVLPTTVTILCYGGIIFVPVTLLLYSSI